MLDIERTPGAGGRAFRLVGDLDTGVARQLQRILSGPASDGEGLTVDLSGLDSCDTECARLLITLTKRARIAEGDLVLTSPSPAVLQILTKIAGSDELNIVEAKVATKR
jgi:anti-anti-sigma factor